MEKDAANLIRTFSYCISFLYSRRDETKILATVLTTVNHVITVDDRGSVPTTGTFSCE